MGILNLFKGKLAPDYVAPTEETKAVDESLAKVELTKKVNLAKEEVQKVCLTKAPLNGLKAHVGLVLDFSGSMDGLYRNGTVQEVVEKILPLAMQFDDNGEMEVWIFDNGFHRLPNITLDNLAGYVARETKKYRMGGTCYAPVIENVVKTYSDSKLPAYVMFLTDGDNSDKLSTDDAIRKASNRPIFWQFVGLGNASFDYLQHLDDMQGRYVDNADFFKVKTADKITYKDLLNEFPSWLVESKVQAMLV